MWESATSVSRFTPICWVLTAIGFPPIHCVCLALGFLPLRRVLRGMLYSLMMLVICLPRLVSPAPIRWSRLGLWSLRCPGVYTLCQMHQGGFYSVHGGSDCINIFLNICQLLCPCFFLIGGEVVILHWPLSRLMGRSKSPKLLLTLPDHLLYKCDLHPAGGCGIT